MNAITTVTATLLLGSASWTSNRVVGFLRINMIAGYRDGQLIAPFTVEGACNRTVFETWLETCAMPVLRPGEWGKRR